MKRLWFAVVMAVLFAGCAKGTAPEEADAGVGHLRVFYYQDWYELEDREHKVRCYALAPSGRTGTSLSCVKDAP